MNPNPDGRTLSQLFGDSLSQLAKLIQNEIDLARAELREKVVLGKGRDRANSIGRRPISSGIGSHPFWHRDLVDHARLGCAACIPVLWTWSGNYCVRACLGGCETAVGRRLKNLRRLWTKSDGTRWWRRS